MNIKSNFLIKYFIRFGLAILFMVLFPVYTNAAFVLIDHTERNGINNWEKFREGNNYREVFRYPGNDAPNNHHWIAPSNIKDGKALVEIWGGGGNGGHGFTKYRIGDGGAGSGGGAGGYIFANDGVTPGARYSMYIGAGGTEKYPSIVSSSTNTSNSQETPVDDPLRLLGAGAGGDASVFKYDWWDTGYPAKSADDKVIAAGGGGGGVNIFFNPCYTYDPHNPDYAYCNWKFIPWPNDRVAGLCDPFWGGARNLNLWVLSTYNLNVFNIVQNMLNDIFTQKGKDIPEVCLNARLNILGTGGQSGWYEGYGGPVGTEKSRGGLNGKGVVVNRYPNSVSDITSPDVGYYYIDSLNRGSDGGAYTFMGPGGAAYGSHQGDDPAGAPATISPFTGYAFGKGGDGKLSENEFGLGDNGGVVISYTICPVDNQNCPGIVIPTDNSYIDIGLRINQGSNTSPNIQKIAIESPTGPNSSPLMISKNNKKYHVALVDPTDPDATKIIINAGSWGKKALRKYTGTDGITN